MDIDCDSAYDAELISLLIAHEVAGSRTVTVWSDCEAAMKRLNSKYLGPLSQCLSGWKRKPHVSFKKVRAHPEARLPPDLWSTEERGNYLADRVAGGFLEPTVTISAASWLRYLSLTSKIYLNTPDGTPLIRDIKYIKSKHDILQYLQERDAYREAAKKHPIWNGANIALHHKLLGRSRKTGDRIITQRIGLTKRWQWHSSRLDNCCQACE
jgi:hypothetical protein